MKKAQKSVLVVEDDQCLQMLIDIFMTRHGWDVHLVGNGQEALDYLKTNPPPSIIILDLRMPKMDGWQFMNIQKTFPNFRAIPIVVYSAEFDHPADFQTPPNFHSFVCKTSISTLAQSSLEAHQYQS